MTLHWEAIFTDSTDYLLLCDTPTGAAYTQLLVLRERLYSE